MKVIAIIAQKGGASKTTLAVHLAVESFNDGKNSIVIDLDPQQSASFWKDLRQNDMPVVVSAQYARLGQEIDKARKYGADLVFIDTSASSDVIAAAAASHADFIIIPTKCDAFDLQTVPKSVDIAKFSKKPTAIVMTILPPTGITPQQAKEALENLGVEISPQSTTLRAAYKHATNRGLTAGEYEPHGKAAEEIKALYKWILNKVS